MEEFVFGAVAREHAAEITAAQKPHRERRISEEEITCSFRLD